MASCRAAWSLSCAPPSELGTPVDGEGLRPLVTFQKDLSVCEGLAPVFNPRPLPCSQLGRAAGASVGGRGALNAAFQVGPREVQEHGLEAGRSPPWGLPAP